MGDAFDLFVAHLFGDDFDHPRLVDLIGHLIDDDGKAVLANFLDAGLGAHDDRTATFKIGFAGPGAAKDGGAGRKIGGGDELHQGFGAEIGVFDQGKGAVDDFAEVMGRNAGGHADGDAFGTVDQHVGKAGGQDGGFAVLAVIIVLKINGVLVDVGQKESGGLVHPHFGIAHGGGGIAVHRAEVALAVQQFQAHRKGLRHADQGIIDRAVAVRVVFAHGVADRAGRFAVRLVVGVGRLMHRKQDAAVDRFQAVAQIGDGAADDDRHGIVKIGRLHLGHDIDLRAVMGGAFGHVGGGGFGIFRRIGHGDGTFLGGQDIVGQTLHHPAFGVQWRNGFAACRLVREPIFLQENC